MISFYVQGNPQGKGRPRVTKYGTYTPEKTKEYEQLVRWSWKAQSGEVIANRPIVARITAYMPIPKSTSKKKQAAMIGTPHTKKPDADNIAKAVLDALNGYAYTDDSSVCVLLVKKVYGVHPCVSVEIEEV